MVVKSELENLGLYCISVDPGQVEVLGPLSESQLRNFKVALLNAGLELIEDRKNIFIERINTIIINMLYN
jgi:hypothetical protein